MEEKQILLIFVPFYWFDQKQLFKQIQFFLWICPFSNMLRKTNFLSFSVLHSEIVTFCLQREDLCEFPPECQSAFLAAKSALVTATLLHHLHSNAKTSITVDASDRAVSGQLEQLLNGIWCPVAFFSRKLSNAERKYSTFDRELLAIFLAVKHFRHHIEGHQFTIFTASAVERSPRQTRHMSFISEFSTDV